MESINELIRPSDVCVIISELWQIRSKGEKRRRIVALVESENEEDSCVLIIQLSPAKSASVQHVLPILSDFKMSLFQSKPVLLRDTIKCADFILALISQGREIKLMEHSLEPIVPILNLLKERLGTAKDDSFERRYKWINFYENRTVALSGSGDSSSPSKANPFLNDDTADQSRPTTTKQIKEHYMAQKLLERQAVFVTYKDAKIFIGTWNVNGRVPNEDLSPWLDSQIDDGEPDLYVLGFQELDMSTEAYLLSDKTKENEWCRCIEDFLGKRVAMYTKIASKQLVGMLILVYAKSESEGQISEVTSEYVTTGLLGMVGNKGAVACRLRFNDAYFCFVNSHLAADTLQVERRNQDYADICKRMLFPVNSKYSDFQTYVWQNPWVPNGSKSLWLGAEPKRTQNSIFDSEVPLPEPDVKDFLEARQFKRLLEFDQLNIEKNGRRTFLDFAEAEITFAPSYKYDVGTSQFDSSEKKRAPSWCDRILWQNNSLKRNEPDWIKCKSYGCTMELKLSDHKPVFATYAAKVRCIDPEKFHTVNEEIMKELDRLENESLPELSLNVQLLEFGSIKYMEPSTQSFVVENVGQVIAKFEFIPKGQDNLVSQPWCTLNPNSCSLLAGESMRVFVTILVNDSKLATALNFGMQSLDDTLILHTENGKDHFLSVSGTWRPTCYGNDLIVLSSLAEPVGTCTPDILKMRLQLRSKPHDSSVDAKTSPSTKEEAATTTAEPENNNLPALPKVNGEIGTATLAEKPVQKFSVPKEIWRLVDFIYKFGMDVDNLFESHTTGAGGGDPVIMAYIRECLDMNAEFDLEALLLDSSGEFTSPSIDLNLGATTEDAGSKSRRGSLVVSPLTPAAGGSGGGGEPVTPTGMLRLDVDLLLKSEKAQQVLQKQSQQTSTTATASTSDEANKSQSEDGKQQQQVIVKAPKCKGRIVSVLSMVECLVTLLDGLAEPVIPRSLYVRCIQEGYLSSVAGRQILRNVHRVHHNTLDYLCSFLKEIHASYSGTPGFNVESLSKVWAPLLLKPSTSFTPNERTSSATAGVLGGKDVGGFGPELRRVLFLMHLLE